MSFVTFWVLLHFQFSGFVKFWVCEYCYFFKFFDYVWLLTSQHLQKKTLQDILSYSRKERNWKWKEASVSIFKQDFVSLVTNIKNSMWKKHVKTLDVFSHYVERGIQRLVSFSQYIKSASLMTTIYMRPVWFWLLWWPGILRVLQKWGHFCNNINVEYVSSSQNQHPS